LCALLVGGAVPGTAGAADVTPPEGTASLPAFVTLPDVVVMLDANDAESDVTDARLSNDGSLWGAWTTLPAPAPYALSVHAELPWLLLAGLGPRTVYVQVRNAAGLVTDLSASTVLLLPSALTLRTVPPVVVYGSETELRGSLVLGGLAAPAGTAAAVSRRRVDEADFVPADTVTTDATGRFVWTPGPAVNTTYRVAYAGDGTYAPAVAEIEVRVRPRIMTRFPKSFWLGDAVTLRGQVAPAHPGAQVTIERKVSGVWRDFATVTLTDDSAFAARFKPTSPGFKYFRVRMAADAEHAVAITTSRRIVVNNPNPHDIPLAYPHYIVIDHSQFMLYYYEHGRVIRKWPCVLGKPSTPTPLGHFKIYARQPNPGYMMGPYLLSYYGAIGIHGTNQPELIRRFPRAFSHGCARLTNAQITWLYPRVPVGTPVWNIR
jgi:lipoprotein-anchoring transpeptidase ErfK/SrfK